MVAENVKGLILGKARGYVKQIKELFNLAGYEVQLFLLNSAAMGVPQRRERTFFIAQRKGTCRPGLRLNFNGQAITPQDAFVGINPAGQTITGRMTAEYWKKTRPGSGFGDAGGYCSTQKLSQNRVAPTLRASLRHYHWSEPAVISDMACVRLQSYPDDYNFLKTDAGYLCGMSVPPVMMANVASQIDKQWFQSKQGARAHG